MLGTVTDTGNKMKKPGKQSPYPCEAIASGKRQEKVRGCECYQNSKVERLWRVLGALL